MNPSTTLAATHLAEFQKQRDADLLEAAADRLQAIVVSDEIDPDRRRKLRSETLELWLELFALIDDALDPKFDPDDLPSITASPPPAGGVTYPPGVDPAVVTDPAARSEYERRIAENENKTKYYNLQTKLRRLDQRLRPRLNSFIRQAYSADAADRQELEAAIQKLIQNQQRAEDLRKRVLPVEEHEKGR